MNVLYIHGANSVFDSNSERIKNMKLDPNINEVYGFNHSFKISLDDIIENAKTILLEKDVDVVVGCSLGGYLASIIGGVFSLPAIVINPVYDIKLIINKYAVSYKFANSVKNVKFNHVPIMGVYLGLQDSVINPIESKKHLIELGVSPNDIIEIEGDHRLLDNPNLNASIVKCHRQTQFSG